MKKTVGKDIIPLGISIILVLISILNVQFTNYIIGNKHYIGIVLVLISTIIYFKNKEWFIYIFCATLVLGILSFIDIFYISFSLGIGPLIINPIFVLLFIFFLIFNKEKMNQMFPEK